MDHRPARLKFAVIGHQEDWLKIVGFVNSLRAAEKPALTEAQVKEVYKFFPPGKLFDVQVISPVSGKVDGFYIETFISPDELNPAFLWQNIKKVRTACEKAALLGADIVSLGGFASIILESGGASISYIGNTAFTTGNTMTAAFIAESVETELIDIQRSLGESTLLIIGSTGDIGSACAAYFAQKVKTLLLSARHPDRLKKQERHFTGNGVHCRSSIVVKDLLSEADVVISVASSILPRLSPDQFRSDVVICDAGYPKNFQTYKPARNQRIFAGGMGTMKHNYRFSPDHFRKTLYTFPVRNMFHGCILECMVLAMEGKPVPYSEGRGNITMEAMKDMLRMAARHGITASRFYNPSSLNQPLTP